MKEKDRLLKQEAAAEAVLFTMGRAVELRELAAALETGEEEARAAVERLQERYREEGRGLSVIELSGSFQMCTKAEYYENLIRVAKAPKKQALSDVVLETLSSSPISSRLPRWRLNRSVGLNRIMQSTVLSNTTWSTRSAAWMRLDGRLCLQRQRSFCAASEWAAWRNFQ